MRPRANYSRRDRAPHHLSLRAGLDDPLQGFADDVEGIVDDGGGEPRGSELVDGVFFSSDLGTTTFERSRRFDVDDVDDDELHAIAEKIRTLRPGVGADLRPPAGERRRGGAIELEVPGVVAQDLREGLLADGTAREELFGGSVTLDGRLLLVAELADAQLAATSRSASAATCAGRSPVRRARVRRGPAPVQGGAPHPDHRGWA